MAQQLSPELLALLRGQIGPDQNLRSGGVLDYLSNGLYYRPDIVEQRNSVMTGVGDGSSDMPAPSTYSLQGWTAQAPGADMGDVYDAQGNWTGQRKLGTGTSWLQDLGTFAALAGGAYGLGSALTAGAAAGGAGAAAAAPTWDAATSAAWQNGAGLGGDTLSAMGIGEAAGSAGAAGALPTWDAATSAAWSQGAPGLGNDTLSAMGIGSAPKVGGAASLAGKLKGLVNGDASLGDWASLGLGVAGALDSRDKTQTQQRAPWEPAQPFLRQQIGQGQDLSARYQAQPFSQAQQTAYANVGGLLDRINAQSGGLLSDIGNYGATPYQRGQKPTARPGYKPIDLSGFSGLLGGFGTGGR